AAETRRRTTPRERHRTSPGHPWSACLREALNSAAFHPLPAPAIGTNSINTFSATSRPIGEHGRAEYAFYARTRALLGIALQHYTLQHYI
ncbi:unnamed protein product, partial [Nesidiocoris tenuis]